MKEIKKTIVPYPKIPHIRYFIMDAHSRNYHMHNAFEIAYVLEGNCHYIVKSNKILLNTGDIIVVNPNTAHSIISSARVLLLVLQLSQDFMIKYSPEIKNIRFVGGYPIKNISDNAKNIAWKLIQGASCYFNTNPVNRYRSLAFTTMVFADLVQYLPYEKYTNTEYLILQETSQRMERITDYIDANITEPRLLQKAAENEGITPTYLSRLFSQSYKISFQQYLKKQRLEKAMRMLTTTKMPIYDICYECGFQDYRQLNKYCKETYGKTSSEFRNLPGIDSSYSRPTSIVASDYKYSDLETVNYLAELIESKESTKGAHYGDL